MQEKMNENYLLLIPAILTAMFVYLAVLAAVTQIRAEKRKDSNANTIEREASSPAA